MTKHIKIQENVYNTFLALKSREKQQEFLEKCFIYAWEGKEIETKDEMVSIAFLGVKPSLKISETSSNWGGLRENSGRKANQDYNQVDNQDDNQDDNQVGIKLESSLNQVGIKSKSSPFISNKDISNKNISNITNDNKCYQMLSNDSKNNNNIKENKIKENKTKENNIKENKIKEKNIKENKPSIQFLRLGEFKNVCLTNDDYERLKSTNTELDKAIERLDGWLETSNGSKNKNRNHRGYFKTNSWVWEKTGNQVIKPLILDLDEMLKVSEEERKGWTKEQWDKYYEEFEKRGGE
ncbi:MAG: hypothetical protein J6T10_30265 [Methanobrevibacter sp.]|nr:hypothetical protein [Methanobrevibacter sp.]